MAQSDDTMQKSRVYVHEEIYMNTALLEIDQSDSTQCYSSSLLFRGGALHAYLLHGEDRIVCIYNTVYQQRSLPLVGSLLRCLMTALFPACQLEDRQLAMYRISNTTVRASDVLHNAVPFYCLSATDHLDYNAIWQIHLVCRRLENIILYLCYISSGFGLVFYII